MSQDRPDGVAITLRRASPADHPVIADLAHRIWRACFPGIITGEQIEYMLAQRYTPEAMAQAVASGRLIFELLFANGEPCAFAAHGPTEEPSEWKLHQLYVLPDWQGRGLGGRLMEHIETLATAQGRRTLVLTVNRHNHGAQAAYLRRGYAIRAEAKFDIGHGFVMDDFIMEKRLHPPAPIIPR